MESLVKTISENYEIWVDDNFKTPVYTITRIVDGQRMYLKKILCKTVKKEKTSFKYRKDMDNRGRFLILDVEWELGGINRLYLQSLTSAEKIIPIIQSIPDSIQVQCI